MGNNEEKEVHLQLVVSTSQAMSQQMPTKDLATALEIVKVQQPSIYRHIAGIIRAVTS